MQASLLEQLTHGQPISLVPITVEQYHHMMRQGILLEGAPIELIDGLLVRKDRAAKGGNIMTIGFYHRWTVKNLDQRIDRAVSGKNCHTSNQSPITLSLSEPEPDLALVKGVTDDFLDHHPGPADLLAVFEVSDSSLGYDRTTKQRLFAAADIPIYWIINLVDDQIEVYDTPLPAEGRYATRTDFRRGQMLQLRLENEEAITLAVTDILPPANTPAS